MSINIHITQSLIKYVIPLLHITIRFVG